MKGYWIASVVGAALIMQTAGEPADENTRVAWDAVTTDVEGNPEQIANYRIAVTPEGELPTADTPRLLVPGDKLEAALGVHMASRNLPAGTYDVRAYAVDAAGNESGPSNVLTVTWPDLIPPAAPQNFRFVLTTSDLEIEVIGEGTVRVARLTDDMQTIDDPVKPGEGLGRDK